MKLQPLPCWQLVGHFFCMLQIFWLILSDCSECSVPVISWVTLSIVAFRSPSLLCICWIEQQQPRNCITLKSESSLRVASDFTYLNCSIMNKCNSAASGCSTWGREFIRWYTVWVAHLVSTPTWPSRSSFFQLVSLDLRFHQRAFSAWFCHHLQQRYLPSHNLCTLT